MGRDLLTAMDTSGGFNGFISGSFFRTLTFRLDDQRAWNGCFMALLIGVTTHGRGGGDFMRSLDIVGFWGWKGKARKSEKFVEKVCDTKLSLN